jgi:hypothetical protein
MTEDTTSVSLFGRRYAVDRISAGGLADRIEATAAERAAIGATLGIEPPVSLAFSFELRPLSRGRLRLTGMLEGEATQACVVSLDPVTQHVQETVTLELWPEDQLAKAGGEAPGAGIEVALDGPEPYREGQIDVGQIAYEVFAAALEPYPRKPGAEFAWAEPHDEATESAFAVLRKLKRP